MTITELRKELEEMEANLEGDEQIHLLGEDEYGGQYCHQVRSVSWLEAGWNCWIITEKPEESLEEMHDHYLRAKEDFEAYDYGNTSTREEKILE